MSNPNEAGDNKGALLAFLIIALMMIGTPITIGTLMGWFNLFGILGLWVKRRVMRFYAQNKHQQNIVTATIVLKAKAWLAVLIGLDGLLLL